MTMIDNPTWTLSERLRRSRLLAGLEQKDVAAALGVNRATVSLWETGKSEPSATNFVLWAQATGQPIEWLAEGVMCARRDSNPQPSGLYSIEGARCGCIGYHSRGDCPVGCGCGWCAPELWDLAFWSIVCQAEFDTESTHPRGAL